MIRIAMGLLIVTVVACQWEPACASCVGAKAKNGWCESCKVGYKPDGSTTQCRTCHAGATGKAVWCDGCKKGYVAGKSMTCQGCFAQANGGPKCPTCKP